STIPRKALLNMAHVIPYSIPYEFIETPPADHLLSAIYIKHVELIGRMVHRFTYEKLSTSLLSEYLVLTQGPQIIDRLMTISFKGVNRNDPINYTREVLGRGVELSGDVFRYLGHSNSQLKETTCYLMQANSLEIHDLLAQFFDFSKIPKVAKRAKRIALLFSGFNNSISLRVDELEDIDDVERGGYIFTDGCGLMSEELSREIQRSHRLSHQPSVVQIRYQGYKGVLLHCPELQGVKVRFRKSMKKFSIPEGVVRQRCTTLGVVEYSKPYSNAFLNTQLAMVVADNHGPQGWNYLLQLQRDFYDMLRYLSNDKDTALRYLTITGRTDLLTRLREQGITRRIQTQLEKIRRKELEKMLKDDVVRDTTNDDEQQEERKCKLRVLVPRARLVFGVSDPYGELEYDEVFFRPILPETEFAAFFDAQKVVVGRNPCYYPGDVRVLKLAKVEDKLRYAHLSDCIVFPIKGPRPHPHDCSGGDLDGDKYFVSWDNRLIPPWTTNPFKYDEEPPLDLSLALMKILKQSVVSPISRKVVSFGRAYMPSLFGTEEQAIRRRKVEGRFELEKYFACYENDLVCLVNAIYMKYAARYGPSCGVCVQLNRYFSDAVDMNAQKAEVEQELKTLGRQFREAERRERHGYYSNYSTSTIATHQSRQIVRRRHETNEPEGFFGNLWESLSSPSTAPFMEGDNVWTTMEQNAEAFIQEMRRYIR
ncbi:hypothetical protein QZH41_013336, partial [Actinostola sp. cb2023]